MKFISFFAGIGGIDLGLERAGHECVAQCEIDPYAIRVLKKHWPDVPLFGDIKEIDANELPEAELWAGGFPCQDVSWAGQRAGATGKRTGLYRQLLRCVCDRQPKFVLLENVAAILDCGVGQVAWDMAQIGYCLEWDCISAAHFGAPHERDRWYAVAYSDSERINSILGRAYSDRGNMADNYAARAQIDWNGTRYDRTEEGYGQAILPPRLCRVDDGVPSAVDRVRCLGNAVVPIAAEYIGRLLAEIEHD